MPDIPETTPRDHDARMIAACVGVIISTVWEVEPTDRKRRARLARNAAAALIEMADMVEHPWKHMTEEPAP